MVRSRWEEGVRGPDRRRYEVTGLGAAWLDRWASALSETPGPDRGSSGEKI